MAIHVAYIGMVPIGPTGTAYNKETMTHSQRLTASEEPRVLYDATYAPNASTNPTIHAYLKAEHDAGFTNIRHMDNTIIVTTN